MSLNLRKILILLPICAAAWTGMYLLKPKQPQITTVSTANGCTVYKVTDNAGAHLFARCKE